MTPTRPAVLAVIVVVAGAVAYAVTAGFYGALPALTVYPPATLLLLALAEGYTAYTTSARLAGRPRTRPIPPLTVARLAALAKSTSPVAALLAGGYAGFLGAVATRTGDAAAADTRWSALGVAGGLALVAAALLLERACRVKEPPRDPDDRG